MVVKGLTPSQLRRSYHEIQLLPGLEEIFLLLFLDDVVLIGFYTLGPTESDRQP